MGSVMLAAWLPEAASTHVQDVDGPFFGVSVAALGALITFVGLAVVYFRLYRRQDRDQLGARTGPPNPVFLTLWVLGAAGLGVYAFTAGISGFVARSVIPYGSYPVAVTARQGDWDFTYPGGHVADTLRVPVGRAVRLTMTSEDVVQSLSVPALRVDQPVLPGRVFETWFEATKPGTYTLQSNVYGGTGSEAMRSALMALDEASFQAWKQSVEDVFAGRTLVEVGELLARRHGCTACHTVTGDPLVGPTFKDMYGFDFDTVEGSRILVDDAYVRESILTPNVSVIAGFQPIMPPFAGKIDDREIEALIMWLRSLSTKGGMEPAAEAAAVVTARATPGTNGESPAGQEGK